MTADVKELRMKERKERKEKPSKQERNQQMVVEKYNILIS